MNDFTHLRLICRNVAVLEQKAARAREDRRQEVRRLHEKGLTVREISQNCELSRSAVGREIL